MSTADLKTSGPTGQSDNDAWKRVAALALIFLLLGGAGLFTTITLHTLHAQTLGVLLCVGGVLQIWQCLWVRGWRGSLWHFIIAALYIGAAALVLTRPEQASGLFATLIAGILLAIGVSHLFLALRSDKAGGSIITLVSGLGALALGSLLVLKWPVSGLFAVGLFVSLDLLLQGLSVFAIARAARKASVPLSSSR